MFDLVSKEIEDLQMWALKAIVVILAWIICVGGVVVGGIILLTGFATAGSAPQEAVVAALACACAILPYCFARGITEIVKVLSDLNVTDIKKPGNGDLIHDTADETRSTGFNYKNI